MKMIHLGTFDKFSYRICPAWKFQILLFGWGRGNKKKIRESNTLWPPCTLSLSLTLFLSHACIHIYFLFMHAYTCTQILFLSFTHTLFFSLSHTHFLFHACTHTLYLSHTLAHSHIYANTCTHSLIHTLLLVHTLSHSCTHIHSQACSLFSHTHSLMQIHSHIYKHTHLLLHIHAQFHSHLTIFTLSPSHSHDCTQNIFQYELLWHQQSCFQEMFWR